MNTLTLLSARYGAAVASVLPLRTASVLPQAQRQPIRVLQTSRVPAQLSLFMRPCR